MTTSTRSSFKNTPRDIAPLVMVELNGAGSRSRVPVFFFIALQLKMRDA